MIYPDMIMSLFVFIVYYFFFFKQKTAYEMRISDWSSDVCSSDLSGMDMGDMSMRDFSNAPEVAKNPGVQTISPMPMDRTGEPPTGLKDVGHRVLTYRDLVALERNPDVRSPSRSIDIHLTGNMERFMWSFGGGQKSESPDTNAFVN